MFLSSFWADRAPGGKAAPASQAAPPAPVSAMKSLLLIIIFSLSLNTIKNVGIKQGEISMDGRDDAG
jgi:hypothetical protein